MSAEDVSTDLPDCGNHSYDCGNHSYDCGNHSYDCGNHSYDRPSHPQYCAKELMETIPPVMQFIRTEMRSQSATLLSIPQFRVLAFLHRHPQSSLSAVAEHLGVTRATASAMVDRLVQRQLVDRTQQPQERRHVMLKLTTRGSKQFQDSQEKTRQEITALFGELSSEQLSSVAAGLAILKKVFIARDSK